MPEFGSPFSGLAHSRKLTKSELIRAIRFLVAAEYEAVQMYMQLAESIDNKLAAEVLEDIANEERVHAGEFMAVLRRLGGKRRGEEGEGDRRGQMQEACECSFHCCCSRRVSGGSSIMTFLPSREFSPCCAAAESGKSSCKSRAAATKTKISYDRPG